MGYSTREEWVLNSLGEFKRMIHEFEEKHIEEEEKYEIIPFDCKYKKCDKHQIYLHTEGCVICNNQ